VLSQRIPYGVEGGTLLVGRDGGEDGGPTAAAEVENGVVKVVAPMP